MKNFSNPVYPCQVARVTGGAMPFRRRRHKRNKQCVILHKEAIVDADGLKNRMYNPLLPLVHSPGSQLSLPLPLKINERRYCLVEYIDNNGNRFRFIYRIAEDRNGYKCAIVVDQTGFPFCIPPHFIQRYVKRSIQAYASIDILVQLAITNFVYPLSMGMNVGEYIAQHYGVVPIMTRKGIVYLEEKHEIKILLTFLPPNYIKDRLVKELGLPDDYNKGTY